jgi:hypothetical protein
MPEPSIRRVTARLVRQGEEEYAFDAQFWRELGPEKRLEALWDMVLELDAWQGRAGGQPRLQRSILRIERR